MKNAAKLHQFEMFPVVDARINSAGPITTVGKLYCPTQAGVDTCPWDEPTWEDVRPDPDDPGAVLWG